VSGKSFKLDAKQIRPLATGRGGCIASDRITVDGLPVGIMYRTKPINQFDSGWAFLAGDETQAYMDEWGCHGIYDVNTIANYDPHIILFLDSPEGSEFVRGKDGLFRSAEDLHAMETVDPRTAAYVERRVVAGKSHKKRRRGMIVAMWALMTTIVVGCVLVVIATG
jgi:hypothetical protein